MNEVLKPLDKLKASREAFAVRESIRGRLHEKQQQIAQHLEELGNGQKIERLKNAVQNLGKGQISQQEGLHSAFLHITREALGDLQTKGIPTEGVAKEIDELENLYKEYWRKLQERHDQRNAAHVDRFKHAKEKEGFDAMGAEEIARQLEALHTAHDQKNPSSEEAA